MKLHRFLLSPLTFSHDQIAIKDKELLNQIGNVFRMRNGNSFILFDGTGIEYMVEIEEMNKKEIICKVLEERSGIKRSKRLTLVFSMIKKENMELVIQKCTEIGVTTFIPVMSERTIKTGWNFERMEKIMKEAVEQSGFSDMPVLYHEPLKLPKLLEKLKEERENLDGLCVLDFDGVKLASVKHLISVDTIFIGPEGGFSPKERDLFKKYNIKSISLGENALRAETACISAASIFLL